MSVLEVVLGNKAARDLDTTAMQQLTKYHSDYVAKVASRQARRDSVKEKLSYPYWVVSYCGTGGFFLRVVRFTHYDWNSTGPFFTDVVPRRKFRTLEALRAAEPALYEELYLQLCMNKSLIKDFTPVDETPLGQLVPRGDFVDKDAHVSSWWYSESTNVNPVIYVFEKVS